MLPIELNGPATGIILKELVRRAIVTIRNERFVFEANAKRGYGGSMDDVLTSADTAAQAVYLKSLAECFPGVGLIGEEDNLSTYCSIPGVDAYFTIDPLDGTKAFVRQQSHGTASMLAMVINGKVVSAWIGDVNTLELYGYRPGSEKVHRINEFERGQYLHKLARRTDLSQSYCLLRESLEQSPKPVLELARMCKKHHSDGGSIGTWLARLWKGEFACAIMDPGYATPWDDTPLIGISEKLGFVFLRSTESGWIQYDPPLVTKVEERKFWTAVVHESNLHQVPNLH